MTTAWKIAAGLPALVFLLLGLAWLMAPEFASARMRMALLTEDGLSTQIGDLAAFFLMMGCSILIALGTQNRVWLYPTILLLCLAVAGRLIAWQVHGAGLPIDMIAVEGVAAGLLTAVAFKLRARDPV